MGKVKINPNLKIIWDLATREKKVSEYLAQLGLKPVVEDTGASYCPIALTHVSGDLEKTLVKDQKIISDILGMVGIKIYDPKTSPFSPDRNKLSTYEDVYREDLLRITSHRFFIGRNIAPSEGYGVEGQIASETNRLAVVISHPGYRITRMRPPRIIYLQSADLEADAKELEEVFRTLQKYQLGKGLNNGRPVLIGFGGEGEVVDLEELVYQKFPHLKYKYDSNVPALLTQYVP